MTPSAPPPGLPGSEALAEGHTRLEMWESKALDVNIACSREEVENEANGYKPQPPTSIEEAKTRLARILIDMRQVHTFCATMIGEV